MSRKDAVVLASRVLALYLLCWALDAASYMPNRVLSLLHHGGENSVLIGTSYWFRYYLSEVVLTLLRITALAGAAWWFYRCGPRVQRFLLPSQGEEAAP